MGIYVLTYKSLSHGYKVSKLGYINMPMRVICGQDEIIRP